MAEPAAFTASADHEERLVAVREIEAILSSHHLQGGSSDSLVARLRVLCGPAVDPLPRFSTRPR
jgi:hypothetical protein